jgi:hypothetical protein
MFYAHQYHEQPGAPAMVAQPAAGVLPLAHHAH